MAKIGSRRFSVASVRICNLLQRWLTILGIKEVHDEDGSEVCQIIPALLRCQNLFKRLPTNLVPYRTVCLSTSLTFNDFWRTLWWRWDPGGSEWRWVWGLPDTRGSPQDSSEQSCRLLRRLHLCPTETYFTICKKKLAYFLLQSTSGLIKVPLEVP